MRRKLYILGTFFGLALIMFIVYKYQKPERWIGFQGKFVIEISSNYVDATLWQIDDFSGKDVELKKHFKIIETYEFNEITSLFLLREQKLNEWTYLVKKKRGETVCVMGIDDMSYPYCESKECLFNMKKIMIDRQSARASMIFQLDD